jgi:transposase-like protein
MPHTSTKPNPTVVCPSCHATRVIKKGLRKTIHDTRQRYGCRACGHTFIAQVTKHSSYPVKLIMEAISRYNLGYSARDTLRYLKQRFTIQLMVRSNLEQIRTWW